MGDRLKVLGDFGDRGGGEGGLGLLSVPAIMMHIPHFVGEVQLCVEFLQREHVDMGRVQEVTANVTQFIS